MEQYKALDIGKFLAAFIVIAIHAHPVTSKFAKSLYSIAVPFFFIVSSFLFFKRQGNYRTYAKRVGQLYLVWFVMEIGIVYVRFFKGEDLWDGLVSFFHALLLTNTFPASWYLIASIEAIGLCVLLSRKIGNKGLVLIGALLYIPALLFSTYYGNLPPDWQDAMSRLYRIVPVTNSFVIAFIYVVLGKIVAENHKSFNYKTVNILLVISIVLWGGEILHQIPYLHGYKAFVMIPPIAVLLLILLKDSRWNSIFINASTCKMLRNCSTLIYLSHPLFIKYVRRLTGLDHCITAYLIVALCSCAFAILVVKASSKWRLLRYLY